MVSFNVETKLYFLVIAYLLYLVSSFCCADATVAGDDFVDLSIQTDCWENSDITVAPALPEIGKRCTLTIVVHNNGTLDSKACKLQIVVRNTRTGKIVLREDKSLSSLSAGMSYMIKIPFVPSTSDVYELRAYVDADKIIPEKDETNNVGVLRFPVVRTNMFILYHKPTRLVLMKTRWMTHVTFCSSTAMQKAGWSADKERAYWKVRGVKLISHVCYTPWTSGRRASVEDRVRYWHSRGNAIIIDELSNWGKPKGTAVCDAIIAFKKQYPEAWVGVWTAIHPLKIYYPALRKADMVFPEMYYLHSGQYGNSDWGRREFQQAGLANKTIAVLAMDSRRGKDKGGRKCPRWAPTKEEIENQIRSLRLAWPEMKGISLYLTFANEKQILEADELIYKYYIKPVIMLRRDANRQICVTNVGAMDAHNVRVFLFRKNAVKKHIIPLLKSYDKQLLPKIMNGCYKIKIGVSNSYTILQGTVCIKK